MFNYIKNNKESIIDGIQTGNDFEIAFLNILIKFKFKQLDNYNTDVKKWLKLNKKIITNKYGFDQKDIKNNVIFENSFIYQPYGSQSYPDFLIISNNKVQPIEVKSSKCNIPMWNNSLPKRNCIIIFGNYHFKDITFFFGDDICNQKIVKAKNDFADSIRKYINDYIKEHKSDLIELDKFNEYGFDFYFRTNFNQSKKNNKQACLNFFKNSKREILENRVIEEFKLMY